jgi:hypothetical protein
MKNFSLGSNEALLFEGSVVRKNTTNSKAIRVSLYLTNLNLIFEIIHRKLFAKSEVEIEYIPISQIKVYNDIPQIKTSGYEVTVFFLDHEEEYSFDERKEARKFTNISYKLITGKDLGDRGSEVVKAGLSKIDNALGINTMETVSGILERGVIGSVIGGIKGKKSSKAQVASEAIGLAKEIISEKDKPTEQENAVEKLKQIKELLDAGIITQEEFEAKKYEIINNI